MNLKNLGLTFQDAQTMTWSLVLKAEHEICISLCIDEVPRRTYKTSEG